MPRRRSGCSISRSAPRGSRRSSRSPARSRCRSSRAATSSGCSRRIPSSGAPPASTRRAARRARGPACGRGPERAAARGDDPARRRARGGARRRARGGAALARALRDLALLRSEPVARRDARGARAHRGRRARHRRRGRAHARRAARAAHPARHPRARRTRSPEPFRGHRRSPGAVRSGERAAPVPRRPRLPAPARTRASSSCRASRRSSRRAGRRRSSRSPCPARCSPRSGSTASGPGSPLTDEAVEAAEAIGAQAALAIDNARLYQQQKQFADTMQRSLLPRERPVVEGLEVGEVYEQSSRVEVGGDLYDFLALDDGRLAVVLGDVTGHGVDATADMAMAKFVFRSLVREHAEPADFLVRRERRDLQRDRGRQVHLDELRRRRRRRGDGRRRERRASAAAARPGRRHGLPRRRPRPRARHRAGAGVRGGAGGAAARRIARPLHRRRRRGAARRRALR